MTRIRSGNWNSDYRTSMRNGIPEERRRLLIDRGILPAEDNIETEESTVSHPSITTNLNTEPYNYTISYDYDIARGISVPSPERVDLSIGSSSLARATEGARISFDNAVWGDFVGSFSISSDSTSSVKSFKYIKSHDYKPDEFNFNKIHDLEDAEPYLGVELEIDSAGKNDDNAKLVIDTLGDNNVYCVHDGSLTNGFEIVTHPCTLDYHLSLNYETLFKRLVELGYKSHDTSTCGLHIHFNKNYFGESKTIQDLCITKLLYLFEKYWDNFAKFSRRNNNKYASRYGMEENDSMFEVLYKAKAAKESYNGRYRSINLKNENTVEIRVFKGTLKYNTFIATLQFVRKLVVMCRDKNLEDIQMITWNDIVKDADEELRQYLIERELS